MVALAQRIIKLEKKLANRSQTGHLRGNVVYQPSDQEWAAAMEILVAVGAMIPPLGYQNLHQERPGAALWEVRS
jgi:hypothetical protein